MLAFTSGTTGRPKATMHFHRDVLAIADTFSRHVLQPDAGRRVHRHPAARVHLRARRAGRLPAAGRRRPPCWSRRRPPTELAELIAEHGVTVCFTAPTAYRAMIAAGQGRQAVARCARAVSAGEHLPAATWEAFHDATGRRLIDGIGSTEMLHIFISAADDDIRPGATGRPVPGYLAEVVDLDGREVPDGEPGPPGGPGPDRLPLPRRRAADRLRRRTAGTSPATPSSATRTATSGTRRAATT